jgi:uncharacterized protein YaaN involved in tellurite resistance
MTQSTQSSITVTYSLEEILGQVMQKLDRIDEKVENVGKEVVEIKIDLVCLESELRGDIKSLESQIKGDMKSLETQLQGDMKSLETQLQGDIKSLEARLQGDIKNLETEVKGIGKRLDTQEFINRSVVVGFVLALAAGTIKLFFPGLSG